MRTVLTSLLAAFALTLLVPAGAQAVSGRCSPSGDSCYSAGKRDGKVRLVFSTFSYRGKIETCVTPPGGADRTCRRFQLRETRDGVFRRDVAWSRYFERSGPGTYRVTFRIPGADAAFPSVTFKLKG